jgi:alcohol dehydrogenase
MQKEFIGIGSLNEIYRILEENKAKTIFLVTGKKSFSLSGAEQKLNILLEKKEVTTFNNFSSNPKLRDVKKGIKLLQSVNSDLIIAIGGGSVIDMAKLISVLAVQKKSNLKDIIKEPALINAKGVPLVAIPTTSGSGSQATHFAVVYIENEKHSLAHKYVLPDYAIIDSSLSVSSPRNVAASSAMDALSQAVESIWSINSTIESKLYASEAIKLILNFVNLAIDKKNDDALQSISMAAHLSGKAINITKTTAPHAISYILTSDFNIAHGYAVALLITPVAYISFVKNDKEFNKSLDMIFKLFNCNTIDEFIKKWLNLMDSLGLHLSLKELGICYKDLEVIVKNVNMERMKNHPVSLKNKDLKQIVNAAYEGL